MNIEVVTEEPTPPPRTLVLTLTEEEATELATIFYYQVGGHWLLRDNMPGCVRLVEKLEAVGFPPNHDWCETRLIEEDTFTDRDRPPLFKPFRKTGDRRS